MSTATAADVDRLEDRYRVRFAGHPRVSRDPEELREILTALEALNPDSDALGERITGLRELYGKEVDAIVAARAEPFAVVAARLRLWTDLTFSRYTRLYAGQDRRTRDLALLEEIIGDLTGLRTSMVNLHEQAPGLGLDQAIASIDRAVGVYTRESAAIRAQRTTGTPAEQGSRLAELANRQFHTYTLLFAKQSRVSRHPRTLSRILAELEDIRRGMMSLTLGGFTESNNTRNQVIVEERLRAFRQELGAIEAARKGATFGARVSALANAANEVFSAYRDQFAGKSRETCDPAGITDLFERLWPVAREMDLLDSGDEGDDDDSADADADAAAAGGTAEANERNLRLVTDNLRMYAAEFEAIRAARAAAGV